MKFRGAGDSDSGSVQAWLNKGKEPDDQCTVKQVEGLGEGETMVVYRTVAPNEQKVQLINSLQVPSSHHSTVMNGRLNHRERRHSMCRLDRPARLTIRIGPLFCLQLRIGAYLWLK